MLRRLKILLFLLACSAQAEQNCIYTASDGTINSVTSITEVPGEYLAAAKCFEVDKSPAPRKPAYKTNRQQTRQRELINANIPNRPLRPDEIDLNKSSRSRTFQSSLGPVEVSWEASAIKYLDKSAQKTVTSTMRAAARTLGQNSFPPDLRDMNYNWNIVLMDRVPPEADIKVNGSGACHPGWMRPPADIYIAVERIATGCGRTRRSPRATSEALEETLIHEIGHAIEYRMLGLSYRNDARWHREGFATWFESLGANYISGRGVNKSRMKQRVKEAWNKNWRPQDFKGSGEDYARGYAMIATIADKASIRRLQQVYKRAAKENLSMIDAIEEELRWSQEDLYDKVESNFRLR